MHTHLRSLGCPVVPGMTGGLEVRGGRITDNGRVGQQEQGIGTGNSRARGGPSPEPPAAPALLPPDPVHSGGGAPSSYICLAGMNKGKTCQERQVERILGSKIDKTLPNRCFRWQTGIKTDKTCQHLPPRRQMPAVLMSNDGENTSRWPKSWLLPISNRESFGNRSEKREHMPRARDSGKNTNLIHTPPKNTPESNSLAAVCVISKFFIFVKPDAG